MAKTDKIDATVLRLFAEHFHPQLVLYTSAEKRETFKALVALLQDLVQTLTQYKTRFRQASLVSKIHLKQLIENLIQQIKVVVKEIEDLTNNIPPSAVLQVTTRIGLVCTSTPSLPKCPNWEKWIP